MLGFLAGIVIKGASLDEFSSEHIAVIHPSALQLLIANDPSSISPPVLSAFTPLQAAAVPVHALVTLSSAQLAALVDAHSSSLPVEARQAAQSLLLLHASINLKTGRVEGSVLQGLPATTLTAGARALPADLSLLQPSAVSWLPVPLLAACSEIQLASLSKAHVQVCTLQVYSASLPYL
jgi:hypothetical protein